VNVWRLAIGGWRLDRRFRAREILPMIAEQCGEKREEVSHMESCQGVKDTSVTESLHKEQPPLITQQRAALEGPAQCAKLKEVSNPGSAVSPPS
jgi:hypothetical protein